MKLRIKIILCASLVCSILSAQKIWNLNSCIRYSLENNNSLKNAEINQKVQRIRLSQSRLNLFPDINAKVNAYESFGRTVDPATNTYADINNFNNSYGVEASMTLFSGFAQRSRIAFERYNLKVEENRLEQQINMVSYDVVDAYFNLLLQQGVYELYVENLKLMQEQYASMKKFISVGRKAESDVYELDAKLATDSFLFVQQSGSLEKAKLQLKSIMNYPINDSLIVDTLLTSLDFIAHLLPDSLKEEAKQQLPDLKITENKMFAAKKLMAQMRGAFSPSIEAYAGWSTNYYKTSGIDAVSFKNQLKNNAGQYVGLSLKIPIFNRLSKINDFRIAKLEFKKAENNHLENTLLFEKEINEVYLDWQSAENEQIAAKKQLQKCKIAYLTAEKKLTIGQINVIEFYIQKNELLRAKTELLRTNLQLALKEKYVHFLLSGKWESN